MGFRAMRQQAHFIMYTRPSSTSDSLQKKFCDRRSIESGVVARR